jgi:hypothetical protein
MIESTVKAPLAALGAAIQAKDGNEFNVAYGQLTTACNTCHRSYDRAEIVIQSPALPEFSDQDFRPPTNDWPMLVGRRGLAPVKSFNAAHPLPIA